MAVKIIEPLKPQFLKCVDFTSDPFWKQVLLDLSTNKMPNNVYFKNNQLCIRGKPNENVNIDGLNDAELFSTVIFFLNKIVGIKSPTQKIEDKHSLFLADQHSKNLSTNKLTFGDIKKKNSRDLLIELFSIEMQKQFDLSFSQTRLLVSIITVKLLFKTITSCNISILNGKIQHIDGLEFRAKDFFFTDDLKTADENVLPMKKVETTEQTSTDCGVETTKKMTDNFEKYLLELNKKIN